MVSAACFERVHPRDGRLRMRRPGGPLPSCPASRSPMSPPPAGRLACISEGYSGRRKAEEAMAAEPSSVTFETTVAATGNNTGIVVPEKAIEQLAAGKRPPVLVTVNGYEYRNTV